MSTSTSPYEMTSATPGSTGSGKLVTGLFPDRQSAEAAFDSAQARGYTKDDVNLVMSDDTRTRHFSGDTPAKETELGNKAAQGAGIGGLIAALVGWNSPEERVKDYEQGLKKRRHLDGCAHQK